MAVSTRVGHPLGLPRQLRAELGLLHPCRHFTWGTDLRKQQAQKGWWMWVLPLLSLASHPPPPVSPPTQTPRTAVSGQGRSLPRHPCSSQHVSTGCHWFRFLLKGLGCNPWLLLGGEDRPFPPFCLFAFCMGLHTPGFEFWFQAH